MLENEERKSLAIPGYCFKNTRTSMEADDFLRSISTLSIPVLNFYVGEEVAQKLNNSRTVSHVQKEKRIAREE